MIEESLNQLPYYPSTVTTPIGCEYGIKWNTDVQNFRIILLSFV